MSSHTYEVSGIIYDTASGQPLSNFKDNNKDFNSDLEWGDRKFRIEPGFKANEGGDKEGKIKFGGGGVRQYYTGVNKTTGEVTVYRAGQFGLQDDPIGTYNSNGEFVPAVAKDGENFGTITEIEYFSKEKNRDSTIRLAEDIATDQWKNDEGNAYQDPYTTIHNEQRPEEGSDDQQNAQDLEDLISGATILARKKYPTGLEFPTGITDLAQDKLRISVLKFEPAEVGGDLYVDKVKENRRGWFGIPLGQTTLYETTLEGGSPFLAKRGALADRQSIGACVLPIPDGVTDANLVNFGEDKMNPLQMAGANIALKTLLDDGSMDGGEAFATTLRTAAESGQIPQSIASLLTASAIGKDSSALLARTSGKIFNNNLQLLFTGPTLRPFTFQYLLSPRDQTEANAARQIIRMFKQSSAVQRDDVGLFLHSPNTYRLEFLDATLSTHSHLPRIKECALKGFEVNYMPTNSYMTYGDSSMVQYQLTFQFQELDPIFNDDYQNLEGTDSDDNIGF